MVPGSSPGGPTIDYLRGAMFNTFYEILYKVKKIDDEIKNLETKKNKNPSYILDLKEILKQKTSDLVQKETLLKLEQDKLNNFNIIIEDNNTKLKNSEAKLSKITNAKEYHAVNKELDTYKKNIKNFENQKEKQIVNITNINEQIISLKDLVEKKQIEYESSLINFKDNNNLIDRDLNDLKNDKEDLLKALPQDLLDNYKKVVIKKKNSAISVVDNAKCNACNMNLPPQLCNEILKGENIKFCPSCQRLIICVNKDNKEGQTIA